jgi:hypothetical protein
MVISEETVYQLLPQLWVHCLLTFHWGNHISLQSKQSTSIWYTNEGLHYTIKLNFKVATFWVVALCSLVEIYQCFRGSCCFQHQDDELISPKFQASRSTSHHHLEWQLASLCASKCFVLPPQAFPLYHYEIWGSATQRGIFNCKILHSFDFTTVLLKCCNHGVYVFEFTMTAS